jgi:hypothetical protein
MQDKYLRISKYVAVHKEDVECLFPYKGDVAANFVKTAKERGKYDKSHTRRILSIIITIDGHVYTGSLKTKTYMSKLDAENFLSIDSGSYVRDDRVEKQIFQMNEFYRKVVVEKKKSGEYLNMAGRKAVKIYLVMKSGLLYGCRNIKGQGVDLDEEEEL